MISLHCKAELPKHNLEWKGKVLAIDDDDDGDDELYVPVFCCLVESVCYNHWLHVHVYPAIPCNISSVSLMDGNNSSKEDSSDLAT